MNGQQLRSSILQEAIAGRLVPQDPRDEPASELLHRIGSKATLLETEQSLPRGWCATTLSVLCELTDGEYIQNRELINLDAKFLRGQREGNRLKSGRILPAGSLVILVDGENSGEVFKTPIEGYQGSTFKRLVINKNMYEEFVLQVINSHRTKLKKNKVGSAIPHLNKKLFSEIEVLVPPLAEQKRIVAKIEELMPLVDEYEKAQEEFDNLNAGLKSKLRASLLQEAISGRLVPQDPSDEPASKLLKRINPKAIPLETEQPLPQGWCACKMGELIDIVSGVSYEKGDVASDGIRILRGGNIQDGKILTYPDDVFLGTKYRNSTNSVRKGDIVMVASTGSFIALGKTGYCLEGMENTQIGAFLRIIRAKGKSLSPLLNLFFSSDAFKALIRRSSKGTSINNIKNGYITEIVFPLPPLAEQKRIVEKLESLFAVLDSLDKTVA